MTADSDLAIEHACNRLVMEFAAAVDAQDYERLRTLFTADGAFARPTDPDKVIRGVDQIVEAFASRPKNRLSFHVCTNVRITVESADSASGVCRVLLFTSDTSEPEVPGKGRKAGASQLLGEYADRFVRTPEGWRFAERRGRLFLHT